MNGEYRVSHISILDRKIDHLALSKMSYVIKYGKWTTVKCELLVKDPIKRTCKTANYWVVRTKTVNINEVWRAMERRILN
jgi:hypothetical protein